MAQGGRKTKLTDAVIVSIVEVFEKGLPFITAARRANIAKETLRRWLKRGEATKTGKYRQLYEQVEEARTSFWEAQQGKLEQIVYSQALETQTTMHIKFSRVVKLARDDEVLLMERIEQAEALKQRFEDEGVLFRQDVTIKQHLPDGNMALSILERKAPEDWGRYETLKLEIDARAELEAMGINPDSVIESVVAEMERMVDNGGETEGENPSETRALPA